MTQRTKEEILDNRCMQCVNKKQKYYETYVHTFKGDMFFCSPECRDAWNEEHPESNSFIDSTKNEDIKYCNNCKRRMSERYVDYQQEFYCKKCDKEKNNGKTR